MLCLEIILILLHQHHCLKAKQEPPDLFKETAPRTRATKAQGLLEGSADHLRGQGFI